MAIAFLLLTNCIPGISIAGTQISMEAYHVKTSFTRQAIHFSKKDRAKFTKIVSRENTKMNKKSVHNKKKEIAFPKWMLLPGKFAKSGNDQLTRRYGLDINLRNSCPVIQRSVRF